MKKWFGIFGIVLLMLIVFVSQAHAATLEYDTIKDETNIYINIPGNGMLAQDGEIWQNTMVIDVFVPRIENGQQVPAPTDWKVIHVSGLTLNLSRWQDDYNPNAGYSGRWELETLPDSTGDSVYQVSCNVEGQVLTKKVTIHCKTIQLPSELKLRDLDDTVYAYVGQKVDFVPNISPEGWTVPGYPQVRWGFDDEADEFAEVIPAKDKNDDLNERRELTFTKSGTFHSTFVISSDNISVGRYMTFIISDKKEINSEVITEQGAPILESTNIDQIAEETATEDEMLAGVRIWIDDTPLSYNSVPATDREMLGNSIEQLNAFAGIWFDLSLYKQIPGHSSSLVKSTRNPFRFHLEIPVDLRKTGRTFYLLRAHNGTVSILTQGTGDSLEAETDRFSTYLLAYKDSSEPTATPTVAPTDTPTSTPKPVPKTGDGSNLALWICLMLIGLVGVVVMATTMFTPRKKR